MRALAAWLVARPLAAEDDLSFALAGIGGAGVFVAVNHVLLAVMLRFARGHALRESGLFSAASLGLDLVIGVLGVAVAGFFARRPCSHTARSPRSPSSTRS